MIDSNLFQNQYILMQILNMCPTNNWNGYWNLDPALCNQTLRWHVAHMTLYYLSTSLFLTHIKLIYLHWVTWGHHWFLSSWLHDSQVHVAIFELLVCLILKQLVPTLLDYSVYHNNKNSCEKALHYFFILLSLVHSCSCRKGKK